MLNKIGDVDAEWFQFTQDNEVLNSDKSKWRVIGDHSEYGFGRDSSPYFSSGSQPSLE